MYLQGKLEVIVVGFVLNWELGIATLNQKHFVLKG